VLEAFEESKEIKTKAEIDNHRRKEEAFKLNGK